MAGAPEMDTLRVLATGGGTCEICGAKVRPRRRLDYITAAVQAGTEPNNLVRSFVARFGVAFNNKRFHALADMKHFMRKELSESMAALEMLEACVAVLGGTETINHEHALLLDCCCSVGLTTGVLATAYPDAHVMGVDCDTRLVGRTHFEHPSHQAILLADLLSFDDKFDALALGRSFVAVIAVHACGFLALKPIDFFRRWIQTNRVATHAQGCALVLVPCCVPAYYGGAAAESTQTCADGSAYEPDSYERWCNHLAAEVRAADPHVHCQTVRVEGILSPRNVVIGASWRCGGTMTPAASIDNLAPQYPAVCAERWECPAKHGADNIRAAAVVTQEHLQRWRAHLEQRRAVRALLASGTRAGACVCTGTCSRKERSNVGAD